MTVPIGPYGEIPTKKEQKTLSFTSRLPCRTINCDISSHFQLFDCHKYHAQNIKLGK